MNRYEELVACFRKPYVPGEDRCTIVESHTTWEGTRWTEIHENGSAYFIGGFIIPLSTEFLLCKEHEPKETKCLHPGHPTSCAYPDVVDPK